MVYGKRRRSLAQPLHHAIGHVVAALAAVGISAPQDEQSRRAGNDDVANVLGLGKR